MANVGTVYLGYEDEIVTEKNKTFVNYTVNKIGGHPDWPSENIHFSMKCPLCSLNRLLITQSYAPLENSPYHRILYLFACINPNCWNQSESWSCVRCQLQDPKYGAIACTGEVASNVDMPHITTTNTWCSGADDWDENDNGDVQNGNILNVDNIAGSILGAHRVSDDDESNSLDIELVECGLGNMKVSDQTNANTSPVQVSGAAGGPAAPAAELEGGDDPGLVTVDTPTIPQIDIQTIMHETAELPGDMRSKVAAGRLVFVAKFISVEEEHHKQSGSHSDDRVNELLSKYQRENTEEMGAASKGDVVSACGNDEEQYEETLPLHGDRLFHAFITRLQLNPGQILRYTRNCPPLLGAPINVPIPPSCRRCGARLIFELQLLPGLASCLQLHCATTDIKYLRFLSVLVFTCSDSCWESNDTCFEETVVFQPEI